MDHPDREKNYKAVWDRQMTFPEGTPHAWIQWKGTHVGMDFHCRCGAHIYISADFAYYIKCDCCGAIYMTNGHIELVELTLEEIAAEVHLPSCVVAECDDCAASSGDACTCNGCSCTRTDTCAMDIDGRCECCQFTYVETPK